MGVWNYLLPFVTVMKEGSFNRAARRLQVTPAALSQSIAQFEKKLGLRLFHRTTRHVQATGEAQFLFESLGDLVGEVDQRLRLLDNLQGEPSGLIRMSMSSAFGRKHVMPTIASFLERYPKVRFEFFFDTQQESLAESGMDLAVRHGAKHAGFIVRPLCQLSLILVASREYVERRGAPQSVDDLQHHDQIAARKPDGSLLNWKWRPCSEVARPNGEPPSYRDFNVGKSAVKIAVSGQFDALREAVQGGLGIAPIFADYVEDDIESGKFVRILPEIDIQLPDPRDATVFLQYPDRAFLPIRVRALIDHLVARIA